MSAKVPPPPPPPTPIHLLRSHSSPISAVAWSNDNERIYSADSTGKVVVTSTRSLRAITAWNAHTDSILGVEEWEEYIVTHGRDNKIYVWTRIEELPLSAYIGGSAGLPDLQTPTLCYSMDVNALNFCRFSLLKSPFSPSDNLKRKALIALPNLVDSTTIDVWSLPLKDRLHAAIGQEMRKSILSENTGGRNSSGIVMSMHLYRVAENDMAQPSSSAPGNLRVLAAYENGSVVLREYTRSAKEVSVEGQGWDIVWKSKIHVESIMAMKISPSNAFALTVSADHIIGRYDLTANQPSSEEHGAIHRTKHPGNGSLAIRDDGKVCAVGGWDGKIRLYSTKSFKHLGTLKYHKSACQCIEFARAMVLSPSKETSLLNTEINDDDMSLEEKEERLRWLVVGSKDNRVSIWGLLSFAK